MTRALDSQRPPFAAPGDRSPSRVNRSRWRPRFGIRTALLAGLVFCLLFGWIGRGVYRVRQEDAAIEAILRAGGEIGLAGVPGLYVQRQPMADPADRPFPERLADQIFRAVGLSRRPAIEAVALDIEDPNDPAPAKALAACRRLPEIEYVSLTGSGVDDSTIAALDELPRMAHLSLAGDSVSGEGLAKLRDPGRLQSLEIHCHRAPTRLLSKIDVFENLRSIRVSDSPITEADVEAIASLPTLQNLDLSYVLIDGGPKFAPLAQHPRLHSLHLSSAKFDDDEIEALAGMPNLQTLWINGAADEDLLTLANSRSLHTLGVYRPVTEEAVRRLSAERPEWTVVFRDTPFTAQTFRAGVSDANSWPASR